MTQQCQILTDKNWKRMKRPKFADVYEQIHEQVDELGGDLDGALIVALPKGASPRQVMKALRVIATED